MRGGRVCRPEARQVRRVSLWRQSHPNSKAYFRRDQSRVSWRDLREHPCLRFATRLSLTGGWSATASDVPWWRNAAAGSRG
jgi:hypothetical protein